MKRERANVTYRRIMKNILFDSNGMLILSTCGGNNDEAETAESSDGLSFGEQIIADALTADCYLIQSSHL